MATTEAENQDNDFKARPYQIDIYEQALAENVIVYLPTGSGKTFIAVMLLTAMSKDVQRPYSEGGKRSVFVVNTVALVVQQSEYVGRRTGLSCKGYSGDMNVDFWTKEKWLQELEENQVLVMTAQILVDLLNHGYLQLSEINLIIFDECHRAVEDHPMRQIMQKFENCPKDKQPKILAMSASLLNANVKLTKIPEVIRSLEITFHAKIATVSSLADVKDYSTNPKERIVYYQPCNTNGVKEQLNEIIHRIERVLDCVVLSTNADLNQSSEVFKPRTKSAKLLANIRDISEQLSLTGIYGASKAVLLHMIQIECLKKYTDDQNTVYVLDYLILELTLLRKILDDKMKNYTEMERVHKFSCDQVCKLIAILKDTNDMKLKNQKFSCIVFVKRRFTAKTLYHILKNLHESDENFKFLVPNFIVGFSNDPYKNSREVLCITKWNKEVMCQFRNGTCNCLIATDVVDEGIDIPACTLIVRFDPPMDFRAYIQSKGRARYSTSSFTILLPENTDYLMRYKTFKETEVTLQQLLIGRTNVRTLPLEKDIKDELYKYTIESYVVTSKDGVKSSVTEQSAVSLINKYCASLLQSKFIHLSPTWILYQNENKRLFQVSLKLPTICPLKNTIYGDVMKSIDDAKRSAAIKVCKELHLHGELTDNLLPRDIKVITEDLEYLFPHWEDEKKEESSEESKNEYILPGTYKKKRSYQIEHPKPLYSAFPKPGKDLYLHVLHAKPTYLVPHDNRNLVFYNLLNDSAGFAILSTTQLPKIPSFPIFMNVGELNVNVEVNYATLSLSSEEIWKLHIFHSMIFDEVLNVIKQFLAFDKSDLDNSFLVVPVNAEWNISWDIVEKYQHINQIAASTPFHFQNMDYDLALVIPNYRASPNVYVVTQICDEMTPASCFPTDDFYSYEHYYQEKYGLSISNRNQPMLEVKPISKKINCIKPRSMKPNSSKRKRAEILEDFEEHLVPELCLKIDFLPLYWLKATTLPSILHRISRLLVAEDLRTTIVREVGLGVDLPNMEWPALVITDKREEDLSEPILELISDDTIEEPAQAEPELELNGPEIDVLNSEENLYPWSKDQEPSDLDRDIEQIRLIDIEYYHHFMSSVSDQDNDALENKQKLISYMKKPTIIAPPLEILKNQTQNPLGPSPVEIMQALTSTLGKDAFDLERLETLGDSFLKFIVSLFLYHSFPKCNEGILTVLKGRIIGNRNLFYCGRSKKIPGRMKVDEFVPMSNFIPPAYTVPRVLQTLLLDIEVPPNVIHEFHIPVEERLSGKLSTNTTTEMEEIILKWEAQKSETDMEHFLGVQTVSDKTVADSVEALIGVYLKNMGLKATAKLLKWFGILPETAMTHEILYGDSPNDVFSNDNPNIHMPWANNIEEKFSYKFSNRTLLLQAFTHPSYTANGITECYQRLEFLGDAILDFLITSYIYQTCNELTPGGLTDLRSALVNNITFACLAVRYGLHTALLSYAPKLNDIIDRFVKFQEERNYVIDDEILWILLEEEECNYTEYVDVPKVLGDLFESLIGAIYLDCGKNLAKVWEIVYALMHKEIDEFSNNIPKQPVRVIHETQGARPEFLKAVLIEGTERVMVPLRVTIAGKEKYFHGFGANKKQAKCAAAKQALKCLRCKR